MPFLRPGADARDKLQHVAAEPDLWMLHSYLTLLGVLGLSSAVGHSAHLGFYTITMETMVLFFIVSQALRSAMFWVIAASLAHTPSPTAPFSCAAWAPV